jgi:hypothetical protein
MTKFRITDARGLLLTDSRRFMQGAGAWLSLNNCRGHHALTRVIPPIHRQSE